jgi:hypothetical protein
MKKALLLLTVLLVAAAMVEAASTATIRYVLDDQGTGVKTIVKNVPFLVKVEMMAISDNPNNNVRDVLYHVHGEGFTGDDPIFETGSRGEWLPLAGNPDQNKLLADKVWQYLFSAGHGTVDPT